MPRARKTHSFCQSKGVQDGSGARGLLHTSTSLLRKPKQMMARKLSDAWKVEASQQLERTLWVA